MHHQPKNRSTRCTSRDGGKMSHSLGMGYRVLLIALLTSIALSSTAIAQTDPPEERAQAFIDSGRELYDSGNWLTAQEAFESAYKLAPESSTQKAEAVFELAGVLWEQGDYPGAYEKINEAIRRATELKLDGARAQLLLRKGSIEASQSRFSKAKESFGSCIEAATATKDAETLALCRMGRRNVQVLTGGKEDASATAADVKTLKSSKHPVLVGTSLTKMAETQMSSGNFMAALSYLQQAHAQFKRSKSVPSISRNHLRLAEVFQNLDRWNDAEKEMKGIILTFKNMNNRPALVTAYTIEARQKEHAGDGSGAYKDYQKALHYGASIASPQLQAHTRLAICEFFARTQSPDKGIDDCKVARVMFEKNGMKSLATRALIGLSKLEHATGKADTAYDAYLSSIKELESQRSSRARNEDLVIQYANLCQVAVVSQKSTGLADCRKALEQFDNLKTNNAQTNQMKIRTLVRLGIAEQEAGDLTKAKALLDEAVSMADSLSNPIEVTNARIALAQIVEPKDPLAAISHYENALKTLSGLFSKTSNFVAPREQVLQLIVAARTGLSQVYLNQQAWGKAHKQLAQLIVDAKRNENWQAVAWAYLGEAKCYREEGQNEMAKKSLQEGKPFADNSGDADLIASYKQYLK